MKCNLIHSKLQIFINQILSSLNDMFDFRLQCSYYNAYRRKSSEKY